MSRAPVHVALIHWPVFDRARNTVCTNVTNFDIHDIARAARTYGVEKYFIVHRLKEQLSFVSRILDHWRVGTGSEYNPKRKTALGMVHTAESLEDVIKTFEVKPFIVCTSARDLPIPRATFKALREQIWNPDGPPKGMGEAGLPRPILLVFGTGFGLGDAVLAQADALLEPLKGASHDDYRHLSVRSAVSIVLDRLLGAW
ncbi:MAG: RNA methyltransferase [Bdellovibrionales bacterium]|nr:RNA methyltransferase [Bdellovibrionales bacterium]